MDEVHSNDKDGRWEKKAEKNVKRDKDGRSVARVTCREREREVRGSREGW